MASSRIILNPAAYTVAWFAPLEIEARAALRLLDNRHDGSFPMSPGNDYVFQAGDICGHNVIIATFPAGQKYGTGSAAALASQVKIFFPNLWFGLLVGVAAGLPNLSQNPPLDIRLGDILVGLSTGNSAGLVAYDLGKETTNDGFQLLNHGYALANTATVVRSAITSIKLKERNDTDLFLRHYKNIQNEKHFYETFSDPGQDKDILLGFDCDGNEILVQRGRRPDSERTRVWYGSIGSGDTLMKNARERDKLRDKYGLIGLEMEAAGTMDCIPVGVIRGVCDYGDKHKNKDWQPYAAAMAAAYTKTILAEIPPNDVPEQMTMSAGYKRRRDEEHSHFDSDRHKKHRDAGPSIVVEEMPKEAAINDSGVIDAITKQLLIDQLYFDKIDERVTHLTAAQKGTCRWFLAKPEYKYWNDMAQQEDHGGLFWIKGNPGTGKSTLMKFLFEEAKLSAHGTSSQTILSFFFLARGTDDEKSTTGLYRSLLHQLFQKIPETKDSLDWMTADGAKTVQRNRWQEESLRQTLAHAVQKLGRMSLTIFVDALDECNQDQVANMVSFFEELCDSAREKQLLLQVCFSSRHYPTVTIQQGVEVILEDETGHTDDIQQYIKSRLRVPKSNKADSGPHGVFRQEILEKSSGIFLWVVLVLDILNRECSKSILPIKKMRDRLKEIPPRLNDLFQMILARDDDNRDQLKACLKWILFASRPLKPPELYFAVQFNIDKECSGLWDREDIGPDEMKAFVRSSSKGLAEVTRNQATEVQFIHESVRDFLLGSYSEEWSEDLSNLSGYSHECLKDCCMDQLMSQRAYDLQMTLSNSTAEVEARSLINWEYPFLEYAILNLFYHSNAAQKNGIEQKGFLDSLPLRRWLSFNNALEKYDIRRYPDSAKMLYIFSEKNLPDLINILSEKNYFEIGDERYGTPLFAALVNNSREVVEAFLRSQEETLPQESAFHALYKTYCQHKIVKASFGRNYVFTRQRGVFHHLLKDVDEVFIVLYLSSNEVDMDLNSNDSSGKTPLHHAIEKRYVAVITALLAYDGIRVNRLDNFNVTPLMSAIKMDNEAIVQALLTHGDINVNITDKAGYTPLSCAIQNNNDAIIQALLAHHRICVNISDALHYTINSSNEAMFNALLAHIGINVNGIDINNRDISGMTLLTYATKSGNEAAINALLARNDINVNVRDYSSKAPLTYAAESGNEAILTALLMHNDINVNIKGIYGKTPLIYAVESGNEAAINALLMHNGINVNIGDLYGKTPLIYAAKRGKEAAINALLMHNGINVNIGDSYGRTPLTYAAECGKEAAVKALLAYDGIIVDINDQYYKTPLSRALDRGHEKVVALLLDNYATIGSVDTVSVLLLRAVFQGNKPTFQLLLKNNANIETRDSTGRTLLSIAASMGHERIAKLLVDNNANIEPVDEFGRTPLITAAKGGHEDIVKLLLDHNANTDSVDKFGRSALSIAALMGYENIVKLLLDNNAYTESVDTFGQTPLSMATKKGFDGIVELLQAKSS